VTRCRRLDSRWTLAFALALVLGAAAQACSGQSGPRKAQLKEACKTGRDCQYGLECREQTCQYLSFGDCEGEGVNPNGQPQCLSGQKCRDGRCTVQCVGQGDCKKDEVCKIGVCQRGGQATRLCYDNRDCYWPETCYYGQCVTRTEAYRCVSDLDCGVGFRCINGRCT